MLPPMLATSTTEVRSASVGEQEKPKTTSLVVPASVNVKAGDKFTFEWYHDK